MRNICILGSTGSIGTQTLDIISRHGGFRVTGLAAAGNNLKLFMEQIKTFKPQRVAVYKSDKAAQLKSELAFLDDSELKKTEVLEGMDGLVELASNPENDLTVTALVGMIGIRPTIAAIEAGSDIALANKETLVTAGHIIMPLVSKKHVRLLPVDSEHSAIFQCLQGKNGIDGYYYEGGSDTEGNEHKGIAPDDVHASADKKVVLWNRSGCEIDKILLTASGGPFRGMTAEELKSKTAADALKHPNWSMGRKITIDSASMVNKALEVMEAKWLFGVEPDDIEVVIQPKSIIHSAVQFRDGAIMAQLGSPDMRLPIQYALYYPKRLDSPVEKLNLFDIGKIIFERPDYGTFKGLRYGLEAIRTGGSICTVFNAANEYAVARFLEGRIGFTGIYDIIYECMAAHRNVQNPSLDEILDTERWVYDYAERLIHN